MSSAERFPYVVMDPALGTVSTLPYVPIELDLGGSAVSSMGLVDSGATLNGYFRSQDAFEIKSKN